MPYRVLLAAEDLEVVNDFQALALETGEIAVVNVVPNAGELIASIQQAEADVIVLHENLGPLPVLDLARELAGRVPELGLVLIARDSSPALTTSALRAGFRGIIGMPLSLEDLQTTVMDTGAWAQLIRAKFERRDEEKAAGQGGKMLVLAGAKGGVGTTTLAVHLALEALQSSDSGRQRSVCLVDFDLQTGDVRSLLDLTHRRSVADLVDVAHDLSYRQIDESLYVQSTGLRILLPPPEGEFGESVAGDAARRILGGIRSRFDVVIVDVGAVVSEGAAVATEMADQVLVVVTPDVPCLRAANRLLGLWERLQVRKEGIALLVNRFSRDSEIQPDLVSRVVTAPVLKTQIPADFRALEPAINTGVPGRLEEGRLRRAVAGLSQELRLTAPPARPTRQRRRAAARGAAEEGQAAVETTGMMLLMLVIVLLLWELVLAGFTLVLASHAAREAARELAVSGSAGLEQIVSSDLPNGWDDPSLIDVDPGSDRVAVTLTVPALFPAFASPWRIRTEAGTVNEAGIVP